MNKHLGILWKYTDVVDNTNIRLYATGVFQEFSQSDKDCLVNSVFVDHGLYFNIVPPDLEQFYLEKVCRQTEQKT